MAKHKACAALPRAVPRVRRLSAGTRRASCRPRLPPPATRSARPAPDRAFQADAGAAASPWLQTSVERLAEGRSELVGPVATAAFLFSIQVTRRLLGAAGLPGRAAPRDQPDQRDQQDRRSDDIDDPPLDLVHVSLLPRGTCRCSRLYSSQWRDWVPGSSLTPR